MPLREVETSPKATKSSSEGVHEVAQIIRTAWNGTSSAACAIAGCCLRVVRTAIGIPFERPTRFVVSEFSKTAPLFCARKASGFYQTFYLFSGVVNIFGGRHCGFIRVNISSACFTLRAVKEEDFDL